MTPNQAASAVTLDKFAERVGCHFTTASRLKSGERLPGRELFGRIIEAYNLDAREANKIYTSAGDARKAFGKYLRDTVFKAPEADPLEDAA